MKADLPAFVMEKTRQIANLMQQGQFSLAVGTAVELYRESPEAYAQVKKNLPKYILQSDLDDLNATVEMVI